DAPPADMRKLALAMVLAQHVAGALFLLVQQKRALLRVLPEAGIENCPLPRESSDEVGFVLCLRGRRHNERQDSERTHAYSDFLEQGGPQSSSCQLSSSLPPRHEPKSLRRPVRQF